MQLQIKQTLSTIPIDYATYFNIWSTSRLSFVRQFINYILSWLILLLRSQWNIALSSKHFQTMANSQCRAEAFLNPHQVKREMPRDISCCCVQTSPKKSLVQSHCSHDPFLSFVSPNFPIMKTSVFHQRFLLVTYWYIATRCIKPIQRCLTTHYKQELLLD